MGDDVSGREMETSIETFAEYAQARRVEIEAALDHALPRPPHCPARVAEAMRYAIEAGGKRLRPILTLAAADAVTRAAGGGEDAWHHGRRLALPAACAIEMIHTYSLVHDDLPSMDNDSLRRGRPTLHVVYGEGLAILAGDGLLGEAFSLLAHEPAEMSDPRVAERKLRVLKRVGLAVGAGGMLGGQAMDLEFLGRVTGSTGTGRVADAAALADMHARKTGALIRAAATAGAIMAGGTAAQVDALDCYASEIGLAFQIVDDVLDVLGTTRELGKTAGKDEACGKPTYPALHGVDRSRAMAREAVARAERALVEAGLPDDRLMALANWVLERRC
jgi:geranylgeranyl diphosphate synthase, type II